MNAWEILKNEVEVSTGGKFVSMTSKTGDVQISSYIGRGAIYRKKIFNSVGIDYLKIIDPHAAIIFAEFIVEFEMGFDRKRLENFIFNGNWTVQGDMFVDQVRRLSFDGFMVVTEGEILYFGQNDEDLDMAIENHIRKKRLMNECLSINTNEDEPKKRRM